MLAYVFLGFLALVGGSVFYFSRPALNKEFLFSERKGTRWVGNDPLVCFDAKSAGKECPSKTDSFSVMTSNIGYFSGLNYWTSDAHDITKYTRPNLPWGLPKEEEYKTCKAHALSVFQKCAPDVLAIQELDILTKRSWDDNQF